MTRDRSFWNVNGNDMSKEFLKYAEKFKMDLTKDIGSTQIYQDKETQFAWDCWRQAWMIFLRKRESL